MINKWTMEMDRGDYIMGENLHKNGGGENIRKGIPSKIYCNIGKNNLFEIANSSKYLLLGLKLNSR